MSGPEELFIVRPSFPSLTRRLAGAAPCMLLALLVANGIGQGERLTALADADTPYGLLHVEQGPPAPQALRYEHLTHIAVEWKGDSPGVFCNRRQAPLGSRLPAWLQRAGGTPPAYAQVSRQILFCTWQA